MSYSIFEKNKEKYKKENFGQSTSSSNHSNIKTVFYFLKIIFFSKSF